MAVVQGIKEKVHLPIYDCFKVDPEEQLGDVEKSSTLKFFIDVQGKTKLETNLQSAGLLPHYNTFEARALRVVLSDLPPQFPTDSSGTATDAPVLQSDPQDPTSEAPILVDQATGSAIPFGNPNGVANTSTVTAQLDLGLDRIVELLQIADSSNDGTADVLPTEDGVTLTPDVAGTPAVDSQDIEDNGGFITLTEDDLQGILDNFAPDVQPIDEQIFTNNGEVSVLSKIIYNTVTTLYVGEKVMIEMPTWFFPSGAGPYSEGGSFSTHGEPNPMATFRFAEPIFIDRQQNFRVEIDVPDTDVLKELQRIYGPLFIWVVLDGFMTRGVQ
jgi:hypothetical protein